MTTDDQLVTLGALVERAWPVPFDLVRTPRDLDVPLSAPALFDPLTRPPVRAGSVLLGVGVDIEGADAIELVRLAGEGRAAAVALKAAGRIPPPLLVASDATGVALLAVPPEVAWEELYVMLQTAMAAAQAPLAEVYGDDLFALANALAAMVGGPVVIDDPYLRVLAYSAVDESVDRVRRDSILGRSLPEDWRSRLDDLGVFQQLWTPGVVVRVAGDPELGFSPRIAIAVRSGSSILGAIWVAQGERPFDATTESALREAANAAVLPLVRHRLAHDVARRARNNVVRSALEGHASREVLVRKLGFAEGGYFTVVAARVASDGVEADVLQRELAQRLVELQLESFHPGALASLLDERVLYVLLQYDGPPPPDALRTAVQRALTDVGRTLQTTLRAGAGSTVTRLSDVPRSRTEAVQALAALTAGSRQGIVAPYDDVRAHCLLAALARLLGDRPGFGLPGLQRLEKLDRERGSPYLTTLAAYLDAMGDVARAAQALHVHPNTLRYRLQRLTEISQLRLDDPVERFVAELHLRCGLYGPGHDPEGVRNSK